MARVAYLSRATQTADATHTFCVAADGSEWDEDNMDEAKQALAVRCRPAGSTDVAERHEVLLEKCLRQRKGDVEQSAQVLLNVSREL